MSAIDKRILNLSYSSLLQLHSCPRRFQLYKLGTAPDAREEDQAGSLTFAYGHCVGRGIQRILEGASLDTVLWEEFYQWDCDLYADNPKQGKSFFGAWIAIRQFAAMREAGYLDGFNLVEYQGKPAAELSFSIQLPDGFVYRGFVDAVLQHATTGEVLVLECKTSSATHINPAQYKNSAQAIGYSIVLDAIFPELSSYKVLYLVYQSKSAEYVQLPFEKTYYQRARWIQELLLDVELIKLYESSDCYPQHGESCYSYFRECEFYQTCGLSTHHLTSPLTAEQSAKMDKDLDTFQIKVTVMDLIEAQMKKEVAADKITSSISDLPNGDILL